MGNCCSDEHVADIEAKKKIEVESGSMPSQNKYAITTNRPDESDDSSIEEGHFKRTGGDLPPKKQKTDNLKLNIKSKENEDPNNNGNKPLKKTL